MANIDFQAFGALRTIDDLLRLDRFFLFGSGNSSEGAYRVLRQEGKTVDAYFDNSPARIGESRNGIQIYAPARLPGMLTPRTAVLVSTEAQEPVGTQLVEQLHVPQAQVFAFLDGMFRNHYRGDRLRENADKVESIYGWLGDDASRDYFRSVLDVRWTMNPAHARRNPKVIDEYQYDDPATALHPEYVVVDCGAYIGDTAMQFLERMDGRGVILALEPFKDNYDRLVTLSEEPRYKGHIIPDCVAAASFAGEATLQFDAHEPSMLPRLVRDAAPGGAHENQTRVRTETIDSLVARHGLARVDCIKMDIEGSEADALKGAAETIARHHPMIVLAAYHRAADLWELPMLVASLAKKPFRAYVSHNPRSLREIEYTFCFNRP